MTMQSCLALWLSCRQ